MFVLAGDAFPHDTESLRSALALGAARLGADDGAVIADGEFPSVATVRINLTGARLGSRGVLAAAAENTGGGFFSRVLEITAQPAHAASVPVALRVRAEDCVFAFGTSADGTRTVALQSCANGTLDASAATADIEAALLALARKAASGHGAEAESVRLTLTAESERCVALSAVAVAKAMFFTATLTIRGRITLDENLDLRLCGGTCTGDGMIANLAAAQIRPRLAEIEGRAFSIRTLLPEGLRPSAITLEGGASLRIRAAFGGT